MRVAEAQQLVAIAYRQAMLKSVRRMAGAGLIAFAAAAFAAHSWMLAAAGLTLACLLWLFLSADSANKVKRITGLPRPIQSKLWHRYQTDPPFAQRVRVALANDGLSRALDEITRSINAREGSGNLSDVLQRE